MPPPMTESRVGHEQRHHYPKETDGRENFCVEIHHDDDNDIKDYDSDWLQLLDSIASSDSNTQLYEEFVATSSVRRPSRRTEFTLSENIEIDRKESLMSPPPRLEPNEDQHSPSNQSHSTFLKSQSNCHDYVSIHSPDTSNERAFTPGLTHTVSVGATIWKEKVINTAAANKPEAIEKSGSQSLSAIWHFCDKESSPRVAADERKSSPREELHHDTKHSKNQHNDIPKSDNLQLTWPCVEEHMRKSDDDINGTTTSVSGLVVDSSPVQEPRDLACDIFTMTANDDDTFLFPILGEISPIDRPDELATNWPPFLYNASLSDTTGRQMSGAKVLSLCFAASDETSRQKVTKASPSPFEAGEVWAMTEEGETAAEQADKNECDKPSAGQRRKSRKRRNPSASTEAAETNQHHGRKANSKNKTGKRTAKTWTVEDEQSSAKAAETTGLRSDDMKKKKVRRNTLKQTATGTATPKNHAKRKESSSSTSSAVDSSAGMSTLAEATASSRTFLCMETDDDYKSHGDNEKFVGYLTNDDVQDEDVLCGRGGHAIHHSGNQMFREFISDFLRQYLQSSKQEKTTIADGIVRKVSEKGGRFLRRVEEGNSQRGSAGAGEDWGKKRLRRRRSTRDKDTLWEVLPYLQARVKVSQRFREASLEPPSNSERPTGT